MDIVLNSNGDLFLSPKGDIALADSVAQKIRIKLLWLEGEWKWDREKGMPYMNSLLVKNPDTAFFEGVIRSKIFEVDEVTAVKDVSITYDNRTRKAVIRYTALTDYETLKEEVAITCPTE